MAVFERKPHATGTTYAPGGEGNIYVPFSWLMKAELSPDEKRLVVSYTHCVVTVTGAELLKVFEAIADQTLSRVEGRSGGSGGGAKVFVNDIKVEERQELSHLE